MINIDSDKAVLLVSIETVRKAFTASLRQRLWALEKQSGQSRSYRSKNKRAITFFREHSSKVCSSINEQTLQELVLACYASGQEKSMLTNKEPSDVFFELGNTIAEKPLTTSQQAVFTRLTKLIFVSLWSQEMLVLPKGVASVKVPNDELNEIAIKSSSEFLYKALSANPSSQLEFSGAVAENIRKIACNHWLRLILNTNWTSSENVTAEDIRKLIENASGTKHSLLSRYYVIDFLSYLFENHENLKQMYERVHAEINTVRNDNRIKKSEASAARKREYARRQRYLTKSESKTDKQVKDLLTYCCGEKDVEFESLIGNSITNYSIRRIFYRNDLDVVAHPLYSELGEKEQMLVHLIDKSFKAFIDSKRIVNTAPYETGLAFLLCYISVYLPRFFRERDGDLRKFPISFNELTCAYFIARNEQLAELMDQGTQAPLTYFKFIELISERFGWSWNETTYVHLKNAQRYFAYIEGANTVLPDADKFKCSISDSDIPKTRRRSTTVKKVLPREYFKVFLSLLETLEYFIDHINGMADGFNPGIVGGKLVNPTYNQLVDQHCWRSIWGTGIGVDPQVDLSALNYTPVINVEGKYYPLTQILRFYTLTRYRVNGVDEKRASPLAPRILWLMANTGIRQQHLLWLDKDGFDAAIPSKVTALAPLIVSTDKAHSEWVSIVSKDVIEVCQRQRDWLEKNELESLKEPMWYSNTEKSRFGKFIPLFRLDSSPGNWQVHRDLGKVMWTLEKFIRHQIGDTDCPTLAYWRPSNSEKTPGKVSDHKLDIEEFRPEDVDLSWEWRLYSAYTAHGLRAAFVSEHMRFLPPSLIGRHLTGQFSESLVWYYTIMEAEDIGDHQQLLINLLMRNEDQIKGGGAPELAQKIASMNQLIAKDIAADPDRAVSTHGLFSLSDVDDSKNGIAELKAKQYTKLAFNPTHICPFNNTCPSEVVQKFGLDKPCALCPYAIRGVMHLPALNAAKFKCVELMEEYGVKIKAYKKRPKTGVIQSEKESLEGEYDRLARDAFALEAIEQQLYHMRNEDNQPYITQDSQTIKSLYETLELNEGEHLIKRLIDVQTFGDLDSPQIQRKFARLRHKLLMASGNLFELLEDRKEPENALLASQLHSMISANELTIRDLYRVATTDFASQMDDSPALAKLGFDTLNLVAKEGMESE